MDVRTRNLAFIMLSVLGAGALVVAGIATAQGREIPPVIAGLIGTVVGSLLALTPPRPPHPH